MLGLATRHQTLGNSATFATQTAWSAWSIAPQA